MRVFGSIYFPNEFFKMEILKSLIKFWKKMLHFKCLLNWNLFLCFSSFQMFIEGPNQDMLIESFLSLGRVDHLAMVMALHPSYLSCFLRTQHALFELDGPLPRDWRHYISIMVRKSL